VTLQVGGFRPGERVQIALRDSDDVLASAVAGPDGSVLAEVRIPEGVSAGVTTVALVGDESEVLADVDLVVAGAETVVADDGAGDLVPLTAAAVALVAAASGFAAVAGRRAAGRRTPPLRSA
jgi:hypothetical protein